MLQLFIALLVRVLKERVGLQYARCSKTLHACSNEGLQGGTCDADSTSG